MRSTEDIIELILDANRNSLLGLDLKVSIATLGLTSGALIAGLFGMVCHCRSIERIGMIADPSTLAECRPVLALDRPFSSR